MDEQIAYNPPPVIAHNHNDSIVDFLRREADLAEDRAKRLRAFADAVESGADLSSSHATVLPYEPAPLDENGVPKYKGKKRGRKPKKRLRKRNPNAKKRAHTAYTLFVQETYPKIKQDFESQQDQNAFQSKNIISVVAKQWKDVPANEKEEWKRKAKEMTDMADSDAEADDDLGDVDGDGAADNDNVAVAEVVNRLESEHEHSTQVDQVQVADEVAVHHHEIHVHEEVVGEGDYYKGAEFAA